MPVGGAIAAVGSVAAGAIGANAQAKAAKSAANAQVQASDQATALQGAIYQDQRNLLAPSITAGADAQARRMLMEGFTPEEVKSYLNSTAAAVNSPVPSATPTGNGRARAGIPNAAAPTSTNPVDTSWVDGYSYQPSSPSYQFRVDQGRKAVERSKAASGDFFSGQTLTALNDYGQQSGSQEFENDFRRLGEIAGQGSQDTGTTVNVAGNYGNSAANNINNAGAARASGYNNAGAAWGSFWGDTVPGGIGTVYGIGKSSGWFGK